MGSAMLHRRHQPATWADVAGFRTPISIIQRTIRADAFDGGALLLTGPSGVGKSTIGRLVVDELVNADSRRVYLNGDRCTEQTVQRLGDTLQPSMFAHAWYGVLVDECHKMSRGAVAAWLNLLDHLPPNVAIVFTTTETPPVAGTPSEIEAFESRTLPMALDLDDETREAFAARVCEIARGMGQGGDSIDDAWKLLAARKWNLRRAINEIPKGALMGKGTQTASLLDAAPANDLKSRLLAGKGRGDG